MITMKPKLSLFSITVYGVLDQISDDLVVWFSKNNKKQKIKNRLVGVFAISSGSWRNCWRLEIE